jgi:hypothetical protein
VLLGGAEESWFWSGAEEGMGAGAGYFSGALFKGMGVTGGYGADENRDGAITLTEMKRYLLDNHGASTPQCYPEEDDFVLFRYDADAYSGRRRDSVVEGVTFGEDVLSAADPTVTFSFTMLKPAQVAYQLVYQQGGKWNFDESTFQWDNAELYGEYGDAPGYLSPGMKERSLTLSRDDTGSYGYVLLQMQTIQDGVPSVVCSRVLCVPPESGDPLLEILSAESFCPELNQEMNFVVHHQYPCELTVTVEDMNGNTVRRLASRQPSRPEQLLPRGSTLCWDGRTAEGTAAEQGLYRLRVKAYVGEEVYEALSEPFVLLSPHG